MRCKGVLWGKSLKGLSTLAIGGAAREYIEVSTTLEMQEIRRYLHRTKLPFIVVGKGSNILFDDQGFDGMVIVNKITAFTFDEGVLYAGAGESFSLLGARVARKGWAGLEFASGIPASVGGAIFMNAGASGRETCDSLVSAEYVDEDGELNSIPKEELGFSYRYSRFHDMDAIIVSGTFQLTPCDKARALQISIVNYRTETQPYGEKSAGCIFRNPEENHAGRLIEKCGLKGFAIGGAQISPLHANFIINSGGASAEDVLSLIRHIQGEVETQTGEKLEAEVRYIPFKR